MREFFFGMSVDDVALANWCEAKNFRKLIDFFDSEGIPATFFVVPVDEESGLHFNQLPGDYAEIIRAAHRRGHAFAQHGLSHNRFELGTPPAMILDLPHEAENKRFARENADSLAQEHSSENCRTKLRQGREILEKALGFPIKGFRAPALQESPGMFQALAEEGYLFDSSNCLQETGWDYILDRMETPPREITRERWRQMRAKSHGLMLPLTCDYTWYLTEEKYAAAMRLAQHDFRQCLEADIPFVTVCHVDPVFEGEGIRFLRELFAFAHKEAPRMGRKITFANMDTIAEQIRP
jgi:peptidoglycan/xylan/chitin deacetylase (PgdA/CDA1 family)